MEHVLNARLSRKEIHVAVGLDAGKALVTRLGKKGHREIICLGREVTSAERLQLCSKGHHIRISETVYDALEDEILKEQFACDGEDHVAKRLTFPRLDEIREEKAAREGTLGAAVVGNRLEATTEARRGVQAWGSTKPWSRG